MCERKQEKMLPLVTISIPLFKCEEFLEKCLLSVVNQTYKNLEVTLIDDKTPDNSVQIAEDFIQKHNLQNWKIYHLEENSGLSVVRNKGIDTAQGKYLFFLDSDDVITPDCIETLVEIAERTQAEMTISQLECEELETGNKSIAIKINSDKDVIEGNDNILREFSKGNLVTYAVNKLFIVDYLRQNKLYFVKGLFAQDELWTFHLVLKMNKIALHKGITYTYFLHAKSVIHNRTKRNFDNWFIIGQHIDQELRKQKGLTQQGLADEISVSKITVLRWENEERQIKPEKAQQLADYFGVSVGYLLGFTDSKKVYDDEKVNIDYDGRIWVYSNKRNKDEDFQVFINCLKQLQILISDDQAKAVFNLIQTMNLNSDGNYWGDFMSYDLMFSRSVDKMYDDLAENGYSLLVKEKSEYI